MMSDSLLSKTGLWLTDGRVIHVSSLIAKYVIDYFC